MFFPAPATYDYVINVGPRKGLTAFQSPVHQLLERGGGPMEAEGHSPELEEPIG